MATSGRQDQHIRGRRRHYAHAMLARSHTLLLLGEEGLADLASGTTELDANNALELAEQRLVGRCAAGLEVGDLV